MNLFFYISYYFIFIFSIIGYGYCFQNLFLKNELKENNLGYLGIYGIFSLIIVSYFSNIFLAHDLIFNSIVILLGLGLFFSYLTRNYSFEKKNIRFLLIIFLTLIVAIFAAKNHDDFQYYHFSYIQLLTTSNLSIGIGQFNHGFRTPSSIFYFASFLYLPKMNYQLIHLAPIFFVGFVNYIFLKETLKNLKKKNNFYLIFFSIFSLAIINVFFYRLAEHGTDRTAQILILLLIFEILKLINLKIANKKIDLSKILILTTIIISLKVFYFIYLILFFVIILYQKKISLFLTSIIYNNVTYICLILISMLVLTNIFNTGCFFYPMPASCLIDFSWSIPVDQVERMNQWYQQWSKAGASPNFRVENPELYIQNFNWLSNWIDIYFFNKVSDFLFGLIFLTLLLFFFLEKKTKSKIFERKYRPLFVVLIFLLFEWFFFHPALRYGGYHLIALIIFLPFSIFFERIVLINDKNIKRVKIFIGIIFVIFFVRNVDRILNENDIYNYDLVKYPSYNVEFRNFNIASRIHNIKKCDLGFECQEDYIKVEKKYIFDVFTKK